MEIASKRKDRPIDSGDREEQSLKRQKQWPAASDPPYDISADQPQSAQKKLKRHQRAKMDLAAQDAYYAAQQTQPAASEAKKANKKKRDKSNKKKSA